MDETDRLPWFVNGFAASASGSTAVDDDVDDTDDDDDEDENDDLSDLSIEDLRAQLKETRESLSKAGGSVKVKRDRIKRLSRELEEARKPKPKKDDDDGDGVDLETVRHEARTEGEKAGIARAKKAEAKSSLLAAGVNPERVAKAVGLLELDEMDLDDDGLDGVDDAIEDLRHSWPELFAKPRKHRESVAGDRGGDDGSRNRRQTTKTASELAAERLLGRG